MVKTNLALLPLLLIFSTGYSMEKQHSSQEVFDPFNLTKEQMKELERWNNNYPHFQAQMAQNPKKNNAILSRPTSSKRGRTKRRIHNKHHFE